MKFVTFEEIKSIEGVLPFAECEAIYASIRATVAPNDLRFAYLWDQFLDNARDYVSFRASWPQLSSSAQEQKSSRRQEKLSHLQTSFEALVQHLETAGWSALWYQAFESDRERLGDFAAYLVYLYALDAHHP